MMTARTQWVTAIGLILAVMAIGCGADLSKLPPIVISAPPPMPVEQQPPAEPETPKATLAFHTISACNQVGVFDTIITITGIRSFQVNTDAYFAIELPIANPPKEEGRYDVTFEADGFAPITRSFILSENRQWDIKLEPVNGCAPPPAPEPAPTPAPPVVTPPSPTPVVNSRDWTDEQWREAFFKILIKHNAGRTVNLQSLIDTRADIEALGAEWQHTSDGTLRPRLYLPVPAGADPFSRAVDVGLYGEAWSWLRR